MFLWCNRSVQLLLEARQGSVCRATSSKVINNPVPDDANEPRREPVRFSQVGRGPKCSQQTVLKDVLRDIPVRYPRRDEGDEPLATLQQELDQLIVGG